MSEWPSHRVLVLEVLDLLSALRVRPDLLDDGWVRGQDAGDVILVEPVWADKGDCSPGA